MNFATPGDVLKHNAASHGDKTAFVFGSERISFSEHLTRASALAAAISGAGVGLQDRVAVMSRNTREFMEVYAAAEISGIIVATVNFRLAAAEVLRVVSVCTPRIMFFEQQYAEIVQQLVGTSSIELFVVIGGETTDWSLGYDEFLSRGDAHNAFAKPHPDDILHLIFTSGSTGRPKGVMRSHRNELAVCKSFAGEIQMSPEDRLLLMMPVFHVGHRFMQLGGHYRAAEIHVSAEFDPAQVVDTIARERITITHLAPTMVKALLDVPGVEDRDLSSLKTIVYSGAPMPLAHLERGIEIFGNVFLQLYGMSEGSATTLHRHDHRTGSPSERRRLASVGKPPPDVELRIADAADRTLPPNAIGEVQFRSPTIMRGYWNESEATVMALRGGWYHTGDMGLRDEEGYVHLVDRAKDMIISGGENIYSREVEDALLSHPSIEDAAVIGIPDNFWGESVLALVVTEDPNLTQEDVVLHCRRQIASYKKPRSVIFVSELPRLASGKIDKVALRSKYQSN